MASTNASTANSVNIQTLKRHGATARETMASIVVSRSITTRGIETAGFCLDCRGNA